MITGAKVKTEETFSACTAQIFTPVSGVVEAKKIWMGQSVFEIILSLWLGFFLNLKVRKCTS